MEALFIICKYCGTLLKSDEEKCPYCGGYAEFSPEEKSQREKQKQEEQKREKLESLPKIKQVSGAFMILASLFTYGLYNIYWYISRRETLNSLLHDKKFPDLGLLIHIIALICLYAFDKEAPIALIVVWFSGIYMAFCVKSILLFQAQYKWAFFPLFGAAHF